MNNLEKCPLLQKLISFFKSNRSSTHPPSSKKEEIISHEALGLIIKYEVGGKAYYNKALKRPTYPGGASGVTIGIGYDLGYNTLDQFTKDWKHLLTEDNFEKLSNCLGLKSSAAKRKILGLRDIEIPWTSALEVFTNSTLPRFVNLTRNTFKGSDKLCPNAFGALVSLVFNRGSSVNGSSRREMYNIREAVEGNIKVNNIYTYIAGEIRSMKRLWVGKGLDGLLKRRESEAGLVESCK